MLVGFKLWIEGFCIDLLLYILVLIGLCVFMISKDGQFFLYFLIRLFDVGMISLLFDYEMYLFWVRDLFNIFFVYRYIERYDILIGI